MQKRGDSDHLKIQDLGARSKTVLGSRGKPRRGEEIQISASAVKTRRVSVGVWLEACENGEASQG